MSNPLQEPHIHHVHICFCGHFVTAGVMCAAHWYRIEQLRTISRSEADRRDWLTTVIMGPLEGWKFAGRKIQERRAHPNRC